MTPVSSCATCAFWDPVGVRDGMCRRRAPPPTERADEIAHWPMTRGNEACGDGAPPDPARTLLVTCSDCQFWQNFSGSGLDPQDRHDKRKDWWTAAGHCVRHAPAPSSDPGCRGFWRATNANDKCSEGRRLDRHDAEPAS